MYVLENPICINRVIKNGLDNYLIPPLKMVVWCTYIPNFTLSVSLEMITYLDVIHSFILNAMGIIGTLKYLDLLSYGVSSKVHLSKKG
jgi:hypothetical protein